MLMGIICYRGKYDDIGRRVIISELIILKDVGLNQENCKGWLSIGARKRDIITGGKAE